MNYVSIDISQEYVNADPPGGVQRLAQDAAGYTALLAAMLAGAVCVLEATSPYGLRLLAALHHASPCAWSPTCRCVASPKANCGAARPTAQTRACSASSSRPSPHPCTRRQSFG